MIDPNMNNTQLINLIIASLVMDIKSAFPETSSSDPIVEKVIFYIRRNFYTDIKIGIKKREYLNVFKDICYIKTLINHLPLCLRVK